MRQLSAKEHRVLDRLAKTGEIDWGRTHANTVNALRRKGLIDGRRVTDVGQTALATVPNIFDDLFTKETAVPKTLKRVAKPFTEFRAIKYVTTELYDPEHAGWVLGDGSQTDGVRLYCTQSPSFGDNARWHLQVRAWVKKKTGGRGKHFAVSNASVSREDLQWLRDQINIELRRKQ